MAKQTIATGSAANDGTGDTLRSASVKINQNFDELYGRVYSTGVSFDSNGVIFDLGANQFLLTGTSPSANRTINFFDADGTLVYDTSTQTLTNKTLTSPDITTPSITTSINDANDNEIIKFAPAGSAVNEITVSNAAAGGVVDISATGTDADIDMTIKSKGEGSIELTKVSLKSSTQSAGGAYTATSSHIITTGNTGASNLDLADGNRSGDTLVFTKSDAGTFVIEPVSFANSGTTITLTQYQSVTLIWDGTNWNVVSTNGATIA